MAVEVRFLYCPLVPLEGIGWGKEWMSRRQTYVRRTLADLPTLSEMVANVQAEAERAATNLRARDNDDWYALQRDSLDRLAKDTGHSVRTVVGVFSALSPATDPVTNQRLAEDLLRSGDCAHPYGDCIAKARRIIDGADPLDVLRGGKTRSFFHNLMRPYSPGHVTIDRHALSIALGFKISDADYKILYRVGAYEAVAAVYRGVARTWGLLPHELQARTWVSFRDREVVRFAEIGVF